VSETIAAALFLLSKKRQAEEIVDRLDPDELKLVVEVVEQLRRSVRSSAVRARRISSA
jgi:hypothetical protein